MDHETTGYFRCRLLPLMRHNEPDDGRWGGFADLLAFNFPRVQGAPDAQARTVHHVGVDFAVIQIPLHRHAIDGSDARAEPAVVQGFAPVGEDDLRRSGKGCPGGGSRRTCLVHDLTFTTCARTVQGSSRRSFPTPTVTHHNRPMFHAMFHVLCLN